MPSLASWKAEVTRHRAVAQRRSVGELMLVQLKDWEAIRGAFSAEEKELLYRAVTGECIWPRGMFVDPDTLPPELLAKLTASLPQTRSASR